MARPTFALFTALLPFPCHEQLFLRIRDREHSSRVIFTSVKLIRTELCLVILPRARLSCLCALCLYVNLHLRRSLTRFFVNFLGTDYSVGILSRSITRTKIFINRFWRISPYPTKCHVLENMVAGSIDDQLADCREIFCYFDSKGDEKINVAQVGDVLRALGQNPTEAEIQKCCEHWTDPGESHFLNLSYMKFTDSRISFEEFVPIYQTVNKNRSSHSLDEFVEGLSHFDKDGNGTINVAELRHLLTTLGG